MSSSLYKRQDFSPSCPSGGQWYACGYGSYFVGCCDRNPCSINSCAIGDLHPAGFDPAYHGTFRDASCDAGSLFYTCAAGDTFLGCCKSNPCQQNGCPKADLTPASLGNEQLRSIYSATGGSTMTSATRGSSTSTSTSTSAPATKESKNIGAIAGGAAGGAFALAVIIGLLIYYFCHAKRSRNDHKDTIEHRQSDLPAMMAEKDRHHPDAPPGYSSPNPNMWTHDQTHYPTYAHNAYPPAPQELPIEPLSPLPYGSKSTSHRRNISELSGDTAVRSELGSPMLSPMAKQGSFAQTPIQEHFVQPPPPIQPHFVQVSADGQSLETPIDGSPMRSIGAQGLGVSQPSPITPAPFQYRTQAPPQTGGQISHAVEEWMETQEREASRGQGNEAAQRLRGQGGQEQYESVSKMSGWSRGPGRRGE